MVVYHKLTIFAHVCLVLHTTNSQDGPMVVGLAPQDASDRLIMFQVKYPVIYLVYFHKHNFVFLFFTQCYFFFFTCIKMYSCLKLFTKIVWCSTESL